MIKLLEEIDELLAYLEDTAHGEEGNRITEMRYRILTELSNSHKHGVMQAGSEKQPYFKLSTNEFGKHWLFYKPLKSEPGKYGCWMPIDDEFYSEFNKLQKAALGLGATVASEGQGEANTCAGIPLCDYVDGLPCTCKQGEHCKIIRG